MRCYGGYPELLDWERLTGRTVASNDLKRMVKDADNYFSITPTEEDAE